MINRQQKIREEIRFWRRLIEKWETTRGDSAPNRMHEAVAAAEKRLNTTIVEESRAKTKKLFH